jgi:hypothetical protein
LKHECPQPEKRSAEAGSDGAAAAEARIEAPVGVVTRHDKKPTEDVAKHSARHQLAVRLKDQCVRLTVLAEIGHHDAAGAEARIEAPVGVETSQ